MKPLTSERLDHLRIRAGIAERMPGQNTVQLDPHELQALLDRDAASVMDVVKIALAGQCSCHAVGCVHDSIRAAASGRRWKEADQQLNNAALERDGAKELLADAEGQLAAVRSYLGTVIDDSSSMTTPAIAARAAAMINRRETETRQVRAAGAGEPADAATERVGKRAAPRVARVSPGYNVQLLLTKDDLEILAEGLEYLHATTTGIVERGGRQFLPAVADLVERQGRLLASFRFLLGDEVQS